MTAALDPKAPLILLRIVGTVFGLTVLLWGFKHYRLHLIRRVEFLLALFLGTGIALIAVLPDTVNTAAAMVRLEGRAYGRLIFLLLVSNALLWLWVLASRSRESRHNRSYDLLIRRLARDLYFLGERRVAVKPVTVIIPALDEAANLAAILPKMPKTVCGRELGVIVVDDGSTDDTVRIVQEQGVAVVSNPINRGGGAALRLGYDVARQGGAEVVVTMDGDGQHRPEEIPRLVRPIINDQADIVIGSRFLGRREKDSVVRLVGIHVFNFVINALAGTKVTDCSQGFRAFRVPALARVLLLQDQFHTAELIIDAARKGLRIGEAPVTVLRRHCGESKKGRNWKYGWSFGRTVMKTWLRG